MLAEQVERPDLERDLVGMGVDEHGGEIIVWPVNGRANVCALVRCTARCAAMPGSALHCTPNELGESRMQRWLRRIGIAVGILVAVLACAAIAYLRIRAADRLTRCTTRQKNAFR